ncbi:hypothetical protein D3C87_1489900 [compost metagenome]
MPRFRDRQVCIDRNTVWRREGVIAPEYLVVHIDRLHMCGRGKVVLLHHKQPGHCDLQRKWQMRTDGRPGECRFAPLHHDAVIAVVPGV